MKRYLGKACFIISPSILFIFSCSDNEVSSCKLIPLAGPYEAAIPKYYFDQEEQRCKEFLWGGCDGVVPFDTLKECQECK